MKRQPRSRRSDSSCSVYSQNSISLANLQSLDLQARRGEEKFLDIYSNHLVPIYESVRAHENEGALPSQGLVKQWRDRMKLGLRKLRTYYKQSEDNLQALKNSVNDLQQSKSNQIKNLRLCHEEELQGIYAENNRQIVDLTAQFSRKQKQYTQTITKFIQTLQESQKNWSRAQHELTAKVLKAEQALKQRIDAEKNNKSVYNQICQLVNELRADPNDSLASLDSLHSTPQSHRHSRRNTIDISSIDGLSEPSPQPQTQSLQHCLSRLIGYGFFIEKNADCIRKIIQITRNCDQPQSLLHSPIYPIILESVRLNLDLGQEASALAVYEHCDQGVVMRCIDNDQLL